MNELLLYLFFVVVMAIFAVEYLYRRRFQQCEAEPVLEKIGVYMDAADA